MLDGLQVRGSKLAEEFLWKSCTAVQTFRKIHTHDGSMTRWALEHGGTLMKPSVGYSNSASPASVASWWNTPNALSLLRILLTPILVVILLTALRGLEFWALGIFWVASLTDLLDGYLARQRAQQTRVGALLDPLADKLLVCSVFIAFVELRLVPAWMVTVVVSRELFVTGLRGIAAGDRAVPSARWLGKLKFVLQVVTISLIILAHRYRGFWGQVAGVSLWLMLGVTLLSMADYVKAFIQGRWTQR